ncbi:Hypothetical predicted protein [Octopus vulgaris]|uniref:Transmembrane protein n=1 Tax=Octopus vulgaris TaxID=6645 RepID=A0AA36EY83_OCTVU|nr:Hypothetical predicted protein [Octopus vulgaris]
MIGEDKVSPTSFSHLTLSQNKNHRRCCCGGGGVVMVFVTSVIVVLVAYITPDVIVTIIAVADVIDFAVAPVAAVALFWWVRSGTVTNNLGTYNGLYVRSHLVLQVTFNPLHMAMPDLTKHKKLLLNIQTITSPYTLDINAD